MAVYLVSDGTNKPYRCKIRAPGFFHLVSITNCFYIDNLVLGLKGHLKRCCGGHMVGGGCV